MLKNGIATLLSLLFTLLLLEGLVRIYYAMDDRLPPYPDPGLRDERKWAAEHIAAGEPIVNGLAGYDAMLGWREPGELEEWLERKSWNPPPVPFEDDGIERTLFLGDSFTAGLYVEPHQAFAYRFGEVHQPHGRSLNLGVSGYGLDQMLLLYEVTGVVLHADTVVLGLYLGGFERALSGFTYYAKPRFTRNLENGILELIGQPVLTPQSLYDQYVQGKRSIGAPAGSMLWMASTSAWQRWQLRRAFRDEDSPAWQLFAGLLDRFAKSVIAHGDRPVLLLIPTRLEDFTGSTEAELQERVIPFACGLGLTTVSLFEAFQAHLAQHPGTQLFRPREDGGHFSVHGHQLTADVLAHHLSESAPGCGHEAGKA